MNRRSLVLGAAALAACATQPDDGPRSLVRRAIAAAGGEAALRRARVLAWTGTAVIHYGDQVFDISVDTVVEPFVYARSATQMLAQPGRIRPERVLEIDRSGGWATRNGQRTPLPEAQTTNERQQFALYGLMRLVTLLDPGVELAFSELPADGTPRVETTVLQVRHPMAVETFLHFDPAARLIGAHNSVASPNAGEAPIAQDISFSGTIEGGGVRWPRTFSIRQNGTPFFDLTLATFTPRAAR